MHVGLSVLFQNSLGARRDADVYHHELGFALQAEMWGFESIWAYEAHFEDESICPDPLQLLTYLAGQTRHIGLGAGVVPGRHDPVGLAEQVVLLDNLSGGRVVLGLLRDDDGDETDGGLDPLVRSGSALQSGLADPRLRPRPERGFGGRIYAAASDGRPEGLTVERFVAWPEQDDREPPPTICTAAVLVDEDAERVEELAERFLTPELAAAVPWGTPASVLGRLEQLRQDAGMSAFAPSLCFGGMPYDEAERNIACFVDQVLPALAEWETAPIQVSR